ncbi:ATP-binding protein [Sphaerisporangium rufum]|uniref:ATP-binding protein n=1 Tax=Sphaerisporangium rufum TaxID=1381558 RepID=UPI00194E1C8F|nr:ATP-binding protein [Sphaerisporangium rufum]
MDRLLGSWDLIGTEASVAAARKLARTALGAAHPVVDDVMLLVSELVTNAVVHSESRGGTVTLTLLDGGDAIRVLVRDAGADRRPRVAGDLWREGGRGLLLVEEISHRWGVGEHHTGRTVWCEVKY